MEVGGCVCFVWIHCGKVREAVRAGWRGGPPSRFGGSKGCRAWLFCLIKFSDRMSAQLYHTARLLYCMYSKVRTIPTVGPCGTRNSTVTFSLFFSTWQTPFRFGLIF